MNLLDATVWAQQQFGGPGGGGVPGMGTLIAALLVPLIIGLLVVVLAIVAHWKIFTKAGEPGWAAIVPIYNVMVLSKICGRGPAFGLLTLIPCVGIIIAIMLIFDLARVFGKGTGFAIGLLLLTPIFLLILAFGDAEYVGDRQQRRSPARGRRRRDDDDDEEDEDDRPRRRPDARQARRRDDDDDDDDRPRRRRVDDDEDDDRPRRPGPRPRR